MTWKLEERHEARRKWRVQGERASHAGTVQARAESWVYRLQWDMG